MKGTMLNSESISDVRLFGRVVSRLGGPVAARVLILLLALQLTGCGGEKHSGAPYADEVAADSHAAAPAQRDNNSESDKGAPAGDKDAPVVGERRVVLTPEGLKLAGLQLQTVEYHRMNDTLSVDGTVEPDPAGVVQITPRVAGRIVTLGPNMGDTVRRGQVLAVIQSDDLARVQADYQQAMSRAAVARANLRRQQKLAALGAFSNPALEAAQARYDAASGQAQQAASSVDAAKAEVSQMEANLSSLTAGVQQAKTRADVLQSQLDQDRQLYQRQLISKREWIQAQANARDAGSAVSAAEASVQQGQAAEAAARDARSGAAARLAAALQARKIAAAALKREQAVFHGGYLTNQAIVAAQADLSSAVLAERAAADRARLMGVRPGAGDTVSITAPIGGVVTARQASLGQSVGATDLLFTILNPSTVWIDLQVYPEDIARVRLGMRASFSAASAPDRVVRGVVSYVGASLEAATRTIPARCSVANPGGVLHPGEYVRGHLLLASQKSRLAVPSNAVQQLDGDSAVFVAGDRNGEFVAKTVQTGDTIDGWTAILSGLVSGEKVVSHNAYLLTVEAEKARAGGSTGGGDEGDND